MFCRTKKRDCSRTIVLPDHRKPDAPGLHFAEERPHLLERLRHQRVVDPSAIAPIRHDARFLQLPEVERQPGLRRVQVALKLAHAALAVREELDDAQPGLFGHDQKSRQQRGIRKRPVAHVRIYQ
jgi:hypothetical protein